jgi:hypothetical protein
MNLGEICFWEFDNAERVLSWGEWLFQLFLYPTIETLILHKIKIGNLEGFNHDKFNLAAQNNLTLLKD